ncbi:HD domain-containing protein (plasmid) [Vibrio mediterranei]|uniref:HD domain-containing protein n=1 Tax=Vibrio mediterranei TaxID=689 RepID=A0A3G4VJU0_9VIBR|nr:HD domain-containing protein [Vibrio mediterranei]
MVLCKKQRVDCRVQKLHNLLVKLKANISLNSLSPEILKCLVNEEGALYSCKYTYDEKTKKTQLAAIFADDLSNKANVNNNVFTNCGYDFPRTEEISLRVVESTCSQLINRMGSTYESQVIIPLDRSLDNLESYLLIGFDIQDSPILDDENIRYYRTIGSVFNVAFELDRHPIKKRYYKELILAITNIVGKELNSRSLHTDIHCKRVPHIAIAIAKQMELDDSHFEQFNLSEGEWEQFSIAAWLHDCGKIKTPDYILNKRTKLDGVRDRIHEIALKFEVKKQTLIIDELVSRLGDYVPSEITKNKIEVLVNGFEIVKNSNYGNIVIEDEVENNLRSLAYETIDISFNANEDVLNDSDAITKITLNLIESEIKLANCGKELKFFETEQANELDSLLIKNGNLNTRERDIMNEHIVDSIRILNAIPFPDDWIDIAHIAGCHHEKPNGKGYPYGLSDVDIPILSQVISVADVFEALISTSRPYKKTLMLSEVLDTMKKMARNGDVNRKIYDMFVYSGLVLKLANEFSKGEAIDVSVEDLPKYLLTN